MPNYAKPLWIVLDEKGRPIMSRRPVEFRPMLLASTTRLDAVECARRLSGEHVPWRKMYRQGYRCMRVKRLEW